jgi:hypothetical protein
MKNSDAWQETETNTGRESASILAQQHRVCRKTFSARAWPA